MSKINVTKKKADGENPKKKKNALVIAVSAVAAIAVIAGTVFGIIAMVASSRAVMEYNGTRMDEKTASYLISVYKTDHIRELNASGIKAKDTAEFWNRKKSDGSETYGAEFARSAEQYLKEILVGVYLYDKYAKMDKKTKDAVEKSAAEVAEYYYNTEGFEVLFDKDAKVMGYDYKSYVKATEMLYKCGAVWKIIYGAEGQNAALDLFQGECNTYLKSAYAHVQLAFIRTKSTFALDENGDRIQIPGGYEFKDLTDAEEKTRADVINDFKAKIDNYNSGTPGETVINPTSVWALSNDKQFISDQSAPRLEKGYYFSELSDYTASFCSDDRLIPIVKTALSLEIDSKGNAYGYCDLTLDGFNGEETVVCFIYKSEPKTNAYADFDLTDFFTDFYKDAVVYYIHPKDILERSKEVNVKKKFKEMPVVEIPYNDIHKRPIYSVQ